MRLVVAHILLALLICPSPAVGDEKIRTADGLAGGLREFGWLLGQFYSSANDNVFEVINLRAQPTEEGALAISYEVSDRTDPCEFAVKEEWSWDEKNEAIKSKYTVHKSGGEATGGLGYEAIEFEGTGTYLLAKHKSEPDSWVGKGEFENRLNRRRNIEVQFKRTGPTSFTVQSSTASPKTEFKFESHDSKKRTERAFLVQQIGVNQSLRVQPTPKMDGEFDDWSMPAVSVDDPSSDAEGAFDLTKVEAKVFGQDFFIRIKLTKDMNLQNGDTEEGTLILNAKLPGDRTLKLDFRARQALLIGPGAVSTIPWRDLRYVSLPTFAASEFELRLDLSSFGVRAGDTVVFTFEGSDKLAAPIQLTANSKEKRFRDLPTTTRPQNAIRVASMNTLRSGLSDPKRSADFKQLMQFADADVYCFNEEWDLPKFQQGVTGIWGNGVNMAWNNGCGIVSKHRLKILDLGLDRGCAVLMTIPDRPPLVIISVHLKCCGYAGSEEDDQRIEQARQVVTAVEGIRQGRFGKQSRGADVMAIGDYNLVGSREPLDLLEAAGLSPILLRSPIDGSSATWRGLRPTESFWPGRLDCLAIEFKALRSVGGYILHPQEASQLVPALRVRDDLSDHAMLVVDLEGAE